MSSPPTCPTASPEAPSIAAQLQRIEEIGNRLWAGGFNPDRLGSYQAAFRGLEQLIAAQGHDDRHEFVIVIPVADRPQHIRTCLDSLLELCRAFGYGGRHDGRYTKVSVVIADDSTAATHVAANREIARHYSALGISTLHLAPDEQADLVDALGERKPELVRVIGNAPREHFGHKGQGVMRNIAALKLKEMVAPGRRLLFWSVDSDQEFCVKVGTPEGDRDVHAVNFFHWLDAIFSRTDALVLTGKVVGDPPVSPAVMTGNFLEDVVGFVRQVAARDPAAPCGHHQTQPHQGEAAYHDMADMFGFKPADMAHGFGCPLGGKHTEADCFAHFAGRLNRFFYGEHLTRVSRYLPDDVLRSVQPARTVYAGNYVFRPEGLAYFIPFASLRLRMSGPMLGRIIRSEIGPRFVSANLPMLHKRTVNAIGQSEFRPGIHTEAEIIDMSGEFERQFYGDVMLFAIERLTGDGFPQRHRRPTRADIGATLDAVRADLLGKYNARQRTILDKLAMLEALVRDAGSWWNRSAEHAAALGDFASFAANIGRNFGVDSTGHARINARDGWQRWRADLLEAIARYPADRQAWEHVLCAA
ncbi:MAG: glycosyltransferase family 2 protein [Betaproteobacteria bacterium]|nr:glycosyltransferase family 2 protein [Betaproteobacteria bacterium]